MCIGQCLRRGLSQWPTLWRIEKRLQLRLLEPRNDRAIGDQGGGSAHADLADQRAIGFNLRASFGTGLQLCRFRAII